MDKFGLKCDLSFQLPIRPDDTFPTFAGALVGAGQALRDGYDKVDVVSLKVDRDGNPVVHKSICQVSSFNGDVGELLDEVESNEGGER